MITSCQENDGHTFNMSDQDIEDLVQMTQGYSGADLKNLCGEASLIPIRQLDDIASIEAHKIRPLNLQDFREALANVKATVNKSDLNKFVEWNNQYGSFPIKEEDLCD